MSSKFLGYLNLGLMLGFLLVVAGLAIAAQVSLEKVSEHDSSIDRLY
jgi:hypothetical protein